MAEELLLVRLCLFDSQLLQNLQSLCDRYTDKDPEGLVVAGMVSAMTGVQALSEAGLRVLYAQLKQVIGKALKTVRDREQADPAQADATDAAKLKRVHPQVDVDQILKVWAQPKPEYAPPEYLTQLADASLREGLRVTLADALQCLAEDRRFQGARQGPLGAVQGAFQSGLVIAEGAGAQTGAATVLPELFEYLELQVGAGLGRGEYRKALRAFAGA